MPDKIIYCDAHECKFKSPKSVCEYNGDMRFFVHGTWYNVLVCTAFKRRENSNGA